MSTQVHAVLVDYVPVPCQCELGYHHEADGNPMVEWTDDLRLLIREVGRHPFCVGACKVWGTPTDEFDFVLVSGRRVGERRIATGLKVTDFANGAASVECWDDDPTIPCQQLGQLRLAEWRRNQSAV